MTNRFASYWNQPDKPLPQGLSARSLNPEELIFLAVHARKRLISEIEASGQDQDWVCAIAAGFAGLLEHCDMHDWTCIYKGGSDWHEAVRPPSVIVPELAYFLGNLSVANPSVYEGCLRLGSIQGFLRLVDNSSQGVEEGARSQRSLNDEGAQ